MMSITDVIIRDLRREIVVLKEDAEKYEATIAEMRGEIRRLKESLYAEYTERLSNLDRLDRYYKLLTSLLEAAERNYD